jgi:MFS family permease
MKEMDSFLEAVLHQNNLFGINSLFYRNLLARIGVYFCFCLEGIYMGVWGRYLPSIQDQVELSDSLLGTAVLFLYFGTVIVSPLVALLLRNFGSRITAIIGAWMFIASLPLIPLSNSFGLLVFFMFTYGFTMGIMDISMNNCGILTEIVAGKPLLGSFHGSYSVAAATGSLIGGVFISAKIETETAFLILFGIATFLSLVTLFHMYDMSQEKFLTDFHDDDQKDIRKALIDTVERDEETLQDDRATIIKSYQNIPVLDQNRGTVIAYGAVSGQDKDEGTASERLTVSEFVTANQLFNRKESAESANSEEVERGTRKDTSSQPDNPIVAADNNNEAKDDGFSFDALWKARKIILFFCLVGFLAAWGESGIITWSVVYFDRYIPGASVIKSLGLTSFMVCMGAGRFCSDFLRHHIGRRWITRIGGVLALGGLLLVVLCVDLPAPAFFACLGFGLTGLGLSTIIPIVFSSAGHLPGVHAGTAIATVACCSYSGSIVSSPTIGLLSDTFGSLRMAFLVDAILLGMIFPLSWGIIEETEVFSKRNQQQQSPYKMESDEPETYRDTEQLII